MPLAESENASDRQMPAVGTKRAKQMPKTAWKIPSNSCSSNSSIGFGMSTSLGARARASASASSMLATLIGLAMVHAIAAGSCREAQLCCSGRDSSCVVQKAPINAIIEDLSDKPCYCDHACLKLGDCCDDFKNHCGVLDCQVSDWGQWSECDTGCGTGMMSRARKVLQAPQNGGKHCPSLVQKRGCQGYRCHGHRDKKILREMALLLPAALSRNRHANDSSDIRRNLRLRYRDSYKHNRDHEYCVEFEVIKASKACHKLPPYNLMMEGDRISVRCDLEALIPDSTAPGAAPAAAMPAGKFNANNNPFTYRKHKSVVSAANEHSNFNSDHNNSQQKKNEITNNNSAVNEADEEEDNDNVEEDEIGDEDEEENMLNVDSSSSSSSSSSNENGDYQSDWVAKGTKLSFRTTSSSSTTTTTTTARPVVPAHYHCRGEGLAGRTTRWSALPAPSCRGKWLRLTIGAPQKCSHAQFIFV